MDENETLKELKLSAKKCKRQIDKLNRTYYGAYVATFEEIIRKGSTTEHRTTILPNTINGGDSDDEQQGR